MANDFVTAAEFSNEQEASIAAGMLKNNGVDAVVDSSYMSTLYGAGSTWAPVRVLVPSDKLTEAIALLKNHLD